MAHISIDVAYIEPDLVKENPETVRCISVGCCSEEQLKATKGRFLDQVFIHGNAKQIRAFAESILAAVTEPAECEECGHALTHHGADGCEYERGDSAPPDVHAMGPCGCTAVAEGK